MSESLKTTDIQTIVTYFLAGVGTACLLSCFLCEPKAPPRRVLGQAVGPPEDTPLGQSLHPADLGEIEPAVLQPTVASIGPQRVGAKIGGSRVAGQRIYTTANVPGADIGQYRLSKSKFSAKGKATAAPAPAPAPTSKFVKQSFPPEIDSRDGMTILPR